jgi:hypothetical protein
MNGERRRVSRRSPTGDEPLARVRLRAGRHLTVVDVSNAGMLVDGDMRLLPGTHVDVHVITGEGRQLVRSRIVRAYVSHVAAEVIRYRGALTFERAVDTAPTGYPLPGVLGGAAPVEGNGHSGGASLLESAGEGEVRFSRQCETSPSHTGAENAGNRCV